ncbi:hypothetical protein [Comamonas testosteroni]|uniref:hypothetical protein n=1 Tax=Comamonas testosteroni TaxID=285 RepID=UPI0012D2AB16|nr:hypothetical protein [Comamonas testosteroni]
MSRISPAPADRTRSDRVDGDPVAPERYQWWTRIIFVALSAVFAVLMFSLLRSFVTLQDYAGAMWIGLFALIAAFFAILATPIRFQDRFMRPILIYGLILDLIINVVIIVK